MLGFLRENLRWIGAGLLLTFASAFGQTWFISLFAGQIKAEHGLSDGEWGGIYTAATLASAALLLSRGGLADSMPLQRLAPTVTLIFALAALGMALSPAAWLLLPVVFGLRFCGQGMMGHIAMTAMGRWFQASRGRAVSLASLGYALGEMLWPSLVVIAIALVGWRETWGMVALLLALVYAPLMAWLLSRPRIPQAAEAAGGQLPGLDGRHWTRAEVLAHPLFHALITGILVPGFIGTVIVFHQVRLSEVKGWALIGMAPAYTIYAGIVIAVSLAAGWAIDRFGAHRLMPAFLLPMGACCLVIGLGDGVWAWYLGLALMALTIGVNNTIWNVLLPQLYGTAHLGAVRSLATTMMIVSTAVGPGITGLLIDLGIGFPTQLLFMAAACVLQSAMFVGVARRIAPAG